MGVVLVNIFFKNLFKKKAGRQYQDDMTPAKAYDP